MVFRPVLYSVSVFGALKIISSALQTLSPYIHYIQLLWWPLLLSLSSPLLLPFIVVAASALLLLLLLFLLLPLMLCDVLSWAELCYASIEPRSFMYILCSVHSKNNLFFHVQETKQSIRMLVLVVFIIRSGSHALLFFIINITFIHSFTSSPIHRINKHCLWFHLNA